ncbi:hypothetical protein ABPG75_012311 [Micractinium tetrahymenae]
MAQAATVVAALEERLVSVAQNAVDGMKEVIKEVCTVDGGTLVAQLYAHQQQEAAALQAATDQKASRAGEARSALAHEEAQEEAVRLQVEQARVQRGEKQAEVKALHHRLQANGAKEAGLDAQLAAFRRAIARLESRASKDPQI